MEQIFQSLEAKIFIFFFIFFRILLFIFIFPLFATVFIPDKIKIALALVLALLLTPIINFDLPKLNNLYIILIIFFFEFLLIFIIALIFRFILAGIQLGGELVGIQMGFGISQTMDPISGFSLPIISEFVYIIFFLFFFTFNFHHYLIYFLFESFQKIPPGSFLLTENLGIFLMKKGGLIFTISLKFLAPLLVFMFLIYITLGILGRIIPQMNVLFVSFPLTIGLGLLFFGLMLTFFPKVITHYIEQYFKILGVVFK
ncbi:MAG: flagellar biosynthetic protein FliR [Thermodesulfobacteriaceae bacterium]|nr:flagellar biosynthetic protein FliR [Thermodesulfobacteriaceae bacterium]MDW8135851.1 flagellar biosynthetic protein FliR [Thermodesulfobacterium sp.]